MAYTDPITEVRRRLAVGEGLIGGIASIGGVLERALSGKAANEAEKARQALWMKRLEIEGKSRAELERMLFEYRKKLSEQDYLQRWMLMNRGMEGDIELERVKAGLRPRAERELEEVAIQAVSKTADSEFEGMSDADKMSLGIKTSGDIFDPDTTAENPEELARLRGNIIARHLEEMAVRIGSKGWANLKPEIRSAISQQYAGVMSLIDQYKNDGILDSFARFDKGMLENMFFYPVNVMGDKNPARDFVENVLSVKGGNAASKEARRWFEGQVAGIESTGGAVSGNVVKYESPSATPADPNLTYDVQPQYMRRKIKFDDDLAAGFWGPFLQDPQKARAIEAYAKGKKNDPLYARAQEMYSQRQPEYSRENVERVLAVIKAHADRGLGFSGEDELKEIVRRNALVSLDYFDPDTRLKVLDFSRPYMNVGR